MLAFVVLVGIIFLVSVSVSWLWLFCARDWVDVFAICFGVALFVSGFAFGGWWWLAAIEGAPGGGGREFYSCRKPCPRWIRCVID
jgi:hypothetical protein